MSHFFVRFFCVPACSRILNNNCHDGLGFTNFLSQVTMVGLTSNHPTSQTSEGGDEKMMWVVWGVKFMAVVQFVVNSNNCRFKYSHCSDTNNRMVLMIFTNVACWSQAVPMECPSVIVLGCRYIHLPWMRSTSSEPRDTSDKGQR